MKFYKTLDIKGDSIFFGSERFSFQEIKKEMFSKKNIIGYAEIECSMKNNKVNLLYILDNNILLKEKCVKEFVDFQEKSSENIKKQSEKIDYQNRDFYIFKKTEDGNIVVHLVHNPKKYDFSECELKYSSPKHFPIVYDERKVLKIMERANHSIEEIKKMIDKNKGEVLGYAKFSLGIIDELYFVKDIIDYINKNKKSLYIGTNIGNIELEKVKISFI